MKKKVRIITIISYNYGNRLQNFALSKVLNYLGYEVKTVPLVADYKVKKMLAMIIKPILGKANNWEKFEKYISYDSNIAEAIDIGKIDYFVAGSDQIWNPYFRVTSRRELLYFARNEQRVSYAASLGITEFPEDKSIVYGEEIKKFKDISVREEEAVGVIKKISGRDSITVPDPVLLLSTDEWNDAVGNNKNESSPYAVFYFLGDMADPSVSVVRSRLLEKGLEIKDILKMNTEKRGSVGPFEFVRLIRDSEFILTDSFHATVFSIMYHKPFVTINRCEDKNSGDMSSRIVSLLNKYHFQNRFIKKTDDLNYDIFECDYTGIDNTIASERNKGLDFLRNALK